MDDLPERIMGSQEPEKMVANDAKELERLIVIQPTDTTSNMIKVVAYWKKHGSLKNYDIKKIEAILRNERQAVSALSDAFKRIVLFEVAGYISGIYASHFSREASSKGFIVRLNQAGMSLIGSQDCSEAYKEIVQTYENLRTKESLQVSGRSEGRYLFDVMDVLNLCAPDNVLPAIDAGFAGRRVCFSINEWGEYTNKVKEDPDFAQFKDIYGNLLKAVCGYLLLRSPGTVEYAGKFLDEFEGKYHILDPSEITLGGVAPIKSFRKVSKPGPLS